MWIIWSITGFLSDCGSFKGVGIAAKPVRFERLNKSKPACILLKPSKQIGSILSQTMWRQNGSFFPVGRREECLDFDCAPFSCRLRVAHRNGLEDSGHLGAPANCTRHLFGSGRGSFRCMFCFRFLYGTLLESFITACTSSLIANTGVEVCLKGKIQCTRRLWIPTPCVSL